METCNKTFVPMDSNLKLNKAEDEEEIDATNYRKLVGCLRYLLHTRPNLSYAVGVLSRYMQSPRTSHGAAMKHVLRYLQGTKSYGLNFKREGDKKLVGFSDSSHDISLDDGKSTAGHIFYFGTSPISWCSQKQPTVALSSCEAEFMAATAAACQAIWLQDLLHEVTGWEQESVKLLVDNQSAIALTKNPVFHGRSKHIQKKYHFIRECVENEQIKVEFVSGEEQKADILTKPLARIKFVKMRSLIGVEDLNSGLGIKRDNVR